MRQNSSPLSYTTLPVASGTSTGKGGTTSTTLLQQTQTGITATSNTTVNQVLPAGFKLSGTIGGAGKGVVIIASAGATAFYSGQINSQTGKYLIVLPAGNYALKVCYTPTGAPAGSVTATYSDSVQVSGDTTKDITLPSVSPLVTVSGTVTGLGGLPSATGAQVSFTSSDNNVGGSFSIAADGSYQGVLPAGNYLASVGVPSMPLSQVNPLQRESLSLYNLGSVTVGSTAVNASFAVPATAKLSGTIRGASLPSLLVGASVIATDTSAAQITASACAYAPSTSSVSPDFTGQYQLILARGRSYSPIASVQLLQETQSLGQITYPLSSSAVNLSGDTTYDFNFPALPAQVTVSGRVTDSSGNGVNNVVISVSGQAVTGAPNLQYSNFATTDANGNYSMPVLSGTSYQVLFIPPAPAP